MYLRFGVCWLVQQEEEQEEKKNYPLLEWQGIVVKNEHITYTR